MESVHIFTFEADLMLELHLDKVSVNMEIKWSTCAESTVSDASVSCSAKLWLRN